MQKVIVEKLSADPQKLVDLQWLEEELYDVSQDEVTLNWNKQRKCVEHQFSDDWEVEYYILKHWAEHVGAEFRMTENMNKNGYYSAFIYR